jgi:hypothetical protein
MRYELSDEEWTAIRPMLPNKPRGVSRVNDRRVLNGIFGSCDSASHVGDFREARYGGLRLRRYQHSQSRRVHLWRQHSRRTGSCCSRFSEGDVTGFTSDERKRWQCGGPETNHSLC